MKTKLILISALFAAPVLAAEPNLQPGQWQYEATTESDMPMMDGQTMSNTECLTQEQIDEQDVIQDLDEHCDVTEMDIRSDGATYEARCAQEGMEMSVDGNASFMGDRTEGTLNMTMETPMGPMTTRTKFTGTRVGDCE